MDPSPSNQIILIIQKKKKNNGTKLIEQAISTPRKGVEGSSFSPD